MSLSTHVVCFAAQLFTDMTNLTFALYVNFSESFNSLHIPRRVNHFFALVMGIRVVLLFCTFYFVHNEVSGPLVLVVVVILMQFYSEFSLKQFCAHRNYVK